MTNEAGTRLAALRARMLEKATELVALGPGSHMQWLLGAFPHPDERPTLMLITDKGEVLVVPKTNADEFRAKTAMRFFEWTDGDGHKAALAAALAHVGATSPRRVAVDEMMRSDFTLALLEALPGCTLQKPEEVIGAARMRKDAGEQQALRLNAAVADRAMQSAFASLKVGASEEEVAGVVRAYFAAEGAMARFWIVGAGANGAFPHHKSSARKLQIGDAVVIDIGAKRDVYTSDITRMAIIGRPPEGYDAIHAIVERAVLEALKKAKPGLMARDVDVAARSVIADAGYGQFFLHRTGHGIGIDGHEPPYISGASDVVLEEGMAFSIEPGIYLPNRFGIRLEEIVIVGANGPEILSSLPRAAHVVEA